MKGIFDAKAVQMVGVRDGDESDIVYLDVEAHHCAVWGTLHSGLFGMLVETAAAKMVDCYVSPSSVNVTLMRPIKCGQRAVARARIDKAGKTLIFTKTEIFVGETLVATGEVTFVVVNTEPPAST